MPCPPTIGVHAPTLAIVCRTMMLAWIGATVILVSVPRACNADDGGRLCSSLHSTFYGRSCRVASDVHWAFSIGFSALDERVYSSGCSYSLFAACMIASGTFFLPTELFSQSEEKVTWPKIRRKHIDCLAQATIATVALAPPAINGCYNLMKWSGVNMDIPTQHGNVMDPLRYLQWCCTMPIIALLVRSLSPIILPIINTKNTEPVRLPDQVCFSFNFTSKRGQSSSILKHREVIMIFANWVIVIGGMAADLSPVPYVVVTTL